MRRQTTRGKASSAQSRSADTRLCYGRGRARGQRPKDRGRSTDGPETEEGFPGRKEGVEVAGTPPSALGPVFKPHRKGRGRGRTEDGTQVWGKKRETKRRRENKRTEK